MSKSILVVDDEPMVGDALARVLSEFDVDVATSGLMAMEKLSANSYAVVVSDLNMRNMSGTELLKQVSANFPATARILMTADVNLDEHAAGIEASHICRLLHKPFSTAALRSAIRDELRTDANGESC